MNLPEGVDVREQWAVRSDDGEIYRPDGTVSTGWRWTW